jgi:hypothetical protein
MRTRRVRARPPTRDLPGLAEADREAARRALVAACAADPVTLVLGAGVSMGYGLPSWPELARALWRDTFPSRPSPLDGPEPLPTSALPIVFELCQRELGPGDFLLALERRLDALLRLPAREALRDGTDTLAVVARAIVAQYRRGEARRLRQVVTLNVDQLLEIAVALLRKRHETVLEPVGRTVTPPGSRIAARSRRATPIPVYHVHGIAHKVLAENYVNTFVFTDAQYWASSTNHLSLANTVMASALFETRCVFVGLSMTDPNLLRWLALRAREFEADAKAPTNVGAPLRVDLLDGRMQRHFWLRPDDADPTGYLTEFLRTRGVRAVPIDGWNSSGFAELMAACFPPPSPRPTSGRRVPVLG